MLIVHYLNNSRAHRLIWLLEELGLDYEIKFYRRGPDYRAPAELKKVHPLGKSPVLEDDGLVIAESGAIFEYLLDKYDPKGLVPQPGTPERLAYTYWLHYAEGSAMPLLVMKLIFTMIPKQVPFFMKPFARAISGGIMGRMIDPQLKENADLWEAELSENGWFAGSAFSAADIIMSFPVEAAVTRAGLGSGYPAIQKWLQAIKTRDAHKRASEKVS
ncbi:glutathione S-transferase [Rhizobium sp. C1]|uniref:glutathione S-transferase n=1 Tax=Rhizobium sp. C1 TaxID=1349799 RepID=UPI001E3DF51B|nr:glutathione S-transferase [Rhizobium sp. C1]MCD2176411.1 glutathione S-transferase [Rhizobium sp. C1]